nr:TMEM165/GDT1 family protein [Candidatus Njordarchaeota archaeon]
MFATTAFVVTFVFIALTELGDKTQLVVIALASRTRRMGLVAAGSTLGISIVILLGVALGSILDYFIPLQVIDVGGAFIFIGLGATLLIQSVRHKNEVDEPSYDKNKKTDKKNGSIFIGSAASVGLMEFGDKTQVATITLAALYDSPLSVALGAILAEAILMIAGAFVGSRLLGKIHKKAVDYISSTLFLAVGMLMLLI